MTQLLSHTFASFTGGQKPEQQNIFRSCIHLHKSCQKLQHSDFQRQFSTSKIIQIIFFVLTFFWKFHSLKHFFFPKWWPFFDLSLCKCMQDPDVLGSLLTFSIKEGSVKCAKVCDEIWVILVTSTIFWQISWP